MTDNTAIKITAVSKRYFIHHEKPTLMESFLKGKPENFLALNNINLTIKKGEKVGIIGSNGSGKTTLLKIISGIALPTKGSVETRGLIVSLIDLEAGFHPDLTGIQNIFLNATVLGMSKKQVNASLDNIKRFANIGRFIDVPLFTYSEGMKVRLGFSIAVHSNPDILVLDENLSVGDEEFRTTCYKKINELFNEGKTIIVASHDLGFIEHNCQKVYEIKKGKIIRSGNPNKIIKYYTSGK